MKEFRKITISYDKTNNLLKILINFKLLMQSRDQLYRYFIRLGHPVVKFCLHDFSMFYGA